MWSLWAHPTPNRHCTIWFIQEAIVPPANTGIGDRVSVSMSHSVGTYLWAGWWIVFRCIVQGFGKKDYCQKNDRLVLRVKVQPSQVQNLLYAQQLQHNVQAWPKLHISDDQHVPPTGRCTEHLLFRKTPLYIDTPTFTPCEHSQCLALEIFGPFHAATYICMGTTSPLLQFLFAGWCENPKFFILL
jgi:hypothetical protein